MNRYVAEELYRIPDLELRLEQAARRERARALRAGFAWLWSRAKALAAPRPAVHPARWIARLG